MTATDITLPATLYLALSYGDLTLVAEALLNDLELRGVPGFPDAPRSGTFMLRVTEEPPDPIVEQ